MQLMPYNERSRQEPSPDGFGPCRVIYLISETSQYNTNKDLFLALCIKWAEQTKKKKKKKMCPRARAKCTDSSHAEPHSYICSLLIISVVIIIIIGFFINVQVQGQHPHQWAPFQVAGLLHAWQISHQISRYVYHEG